MRLQSDYKRNCGRSAKRILSGEWAPESSQIPLADLDNFWREIFPTPSVEDTRSPTPAGSTQWGLVAPIPRDELLATRKGMKDGAPGPDGRKLRDLKGISLTELQFHFNLWLLAGYQPAALRQGETVFIPKVEGHA